MLAPPPPARRGGDAVVAVNNLVVTEFVTLEVVAVAGSLAVVAALGSSELSMLAVAAWPQ